MTGTLVFEHDEPSKAEGLPPLFRPVQRCFTGHLQRLDLTPTETSNPSNSGMRALLEGESDTLDQQVDTAKSLCLRAASTRTRG